MAVAKNTKKTKTSSKESELVMILREHMRNEGDRITSIDSRLDEHIKIYKNNGVESKRVADNLETLISKISTFDERVTAFEKKVCSVEEKVGDMYKNYEGEQYRDEANKKSLLKFIMWGSVAATIVAISAIIVKLGAK